MSKLYPILSERNSHDRDKNVVFDEPTHKYTILTDIDSKYTSVTTWNHTHFPSFNADKVIKKMMNGKNWNENNKYWGMNAQEIKDLWKNNANEVSSAGTNLHFDIECFMNQYIVDEDDNPYRYSHELLMENYNEQLDDGGSPPNNSIEWGYFLDFVKKYPLLTPYRTEWMIYDKELKLAGSIDMVYENKDGTLSIYDWKRSKEISKVNNFNESAITKEISHLPNTNYWHYSLQLNVYKAIIERNYNKKVKELFLIRLHPNCPDKSYELITCADLRSEVSSLFTHRKLNMNK